jgi:DNA-binding transcriptional regulator YhcF (GntR family)
VLRDGLLSGDFAPGAKLPSHIELADQFGVATLTVCRVLAHLEQEGLVSRAHGRDTFARMRTTPAVLIVEDDLLARTLLRTYITDQAIALVLCDIHMPHRQHGIGFIRAVARRWPEIPLSAVTRYPDDLAELHGRPESPFLVLARPLLDQRIETVLRLVLEPRPAYRTADVSPSAAALVRSWWHAPFQAPARRFAWYAVRRAPSAGLSGAHAEEALHDPLTTLPNRALLHDRPQQAILVARRGSKPRALVARVTPARSDMTAPA